jgi:ribose transport system permease protein
MSDPRPTKAAVIGTGRRGTAGRDLRGRALQSYLSVPLVILVALAIANIIVQPSLVSESNWASTLAVTCPYILTAMAETMPILSGNGGLDLSVGPFAGFVTVLTAQVFAQHGLGAPEVLIPLTILVGLAAGALNGALVSYVRLPPIIATLGTYLLYEGLAAQILPSPGGTVPSWLTNLNGSYGWFPGIWIPLIVVGIAFWGLSKTAFYRNLLAVGGDERAAYTAGINTSLVRLGCYAIGGLLAAVAGLLLTGLVQSGDATVGPPYTISAVTAVALGGISLAGGRGGMLGAAIGGVVLFLIQNLLSASHVSPYGVDIVNGAALVTALALSQYLDRRRRARGTQLDAWQHTDVAAEELVAAHAVGH